MCLFDFNIFLQVHTCFCTNKLTLQEAAPCPQKFTLYAFDASKFLKNIVSYSEYQNVENKNFHFKLSYTFTLSQCVRRVVLHSPVTLQLGSFLDKHMPVLCYPPTFTVLLAICSRHGEFFWFVKNSGNALVTSCYGTRPLSRCYHDKMKSNLTFESLLNQFKSENSFLGRRTYTDK